ncbi:MAG: hypothetical protein WC608_00410 [Parcubacteria group bacterium]
MRENRVVGPDGKAKIEEVPQEHEDEINPQAPLSEWMAKNPQAEIPRIANVIVFEKDKHGFTIVHKNYI